MTQIMNKQGGMRARRDDSISGLPTEKYKSEYERLFGKKDKSDESKQQCGQDDRGRVSPEERGLCPGKEGLH